MNPAYILSTSYEKLYSLIEAGIEVVGRSNDHGYLIRQTEIGPSIGSLLCNTKEIFLRHCEEIQLQYIVPNAGQVEELVKAGLEPLEPFTPEFLSMMLSLGISRLTEDQRYALADGLLVRLPGRPIYKRYPEEKPAQECLCIDRYSELVYFHKYGGEKWTITDENGFDHEKSVTYFFEIPEFNNQDPEGE